ncbi:response regulator [Desulfosediminicola flagellatus]|uniref:response regulator n=1 Tax=Desulfosediminicola flagellatus TaxID=2569541 RepID=UPI0010ACA284|nr:response regulator [Desulfosediminicola flagellatus]
MSDKLILIVEDSATHMQIAEDLCTGNGYKVITTDEGEKGIDLAAEHKPDLILLDVILPKQNGYQICRQLKKAAETKDIKVIMVTSKSQPSDKFWGMKQGADDYIFKPYEESDMLAAIQKQIG